MIRALTFTKDWRCFKADDRFEFRPGVNLLVGDQGCGKSSLIQAIHLGGTKGKDFGRDKEMRDRVKLEAEPCKMYKFDFEKDNPRLQSAIGDNALFQISSMWASHGETSRAILRNVEGLSECLLMMDEPDMALSIRSCHMLVRLFRDLSERGSQIIASIHNETVLRQFKDVYSLEHGEWMTSERFIKSQTWGSEFVSVRDRSEKTKKSGFSAPSRQKSDEKSNAQIIQEM